MAKWHLIEDFTYECRKMSLRLVSGNCSALNVMDHFQHKWFIRVD